MLPSGIEPPFASPEVPSRLSGNSRSKRSGMRFRWLSPTKQQQQQQRQQRRQH